jgi:hypothetical protein
MFATVTVSGESMARRSANAYPLSVKNNTPIILSLRHVIGMPPMKEFKRHSAVLSLETGRPCSLV